MIFMLGCLNNIRLYVSQHEGMYEQAMSSSVHNTIFYKPCPHFQRSIPVDTKLDHC